MKRYHAILALICAVTIGCVSSCSCSRKAKGIDAAHELGQKHAAMLCDTTLSSHELHYRLLSVRSREWQMRSNGYDEAADQYISSFEEYLSEHNQELADRIL